MSVRVETQKSEIFCCLRLPATYFKSTDVRFCGDKPLKENAPSENTRWKKREMLLHYCIILFFMTQLSYAVNMTEANITTVLVESQII